MCLQKCKNRQGLIWFNGKYITLFLTFSFFFFNRCDLFHYIQALAVSTTREWNTIQWTETCRASDFYVKDSWFLPFSILGYYVRMNTYPYGVAGLHHQRDDDAWAYWYHQRHHGTVSISGYSRIPMATTTTTCIHRAYQIKRTNNTKQEEEGRCIWPV